MKANTEAPLSVLNQNSSSSIDRFCSAGAPFLKTVAIPLFTKIELPEQSGYHSRRQLAGARRCVGHRTEDAIRLVSEQRSPFGQSIRSQSFSCRSRGRQSSRTTARSTSSQSAGIRNTEKLDHLQRRNRGMFVGGNGANNCLPLFGVSLQQLDMLPALPARKFCDISRQMHFVV